MAQDYTAQINVNHEIQNLLLNYPKRVIRSTTDWLIITIGLLQIEKLDWCWEYDASRARVKTVLEYTPYDCRSPAPWNKFKGEFKITKYGLSVRETPLTVASYTPLWEPDANAQKQSDIMWEEAEKMKKCGTRTCDNGMEVSLESPLYSEVDSLVKKSGQAFTKGLRQKVQDLGSRGIQYDAEKVWDCGVPVTPEIVNILRSLSAQMSK